MASIVTCQVASSTFKSLCNTDCAASICIDQQQSCPCLLMCLLQTQSLARRICCTPGSTRRPAESGGAHMPTMTGSFSAKVPGGLVRNPSAVPRAAVAGGVVGTGRQVAGGGLLAVMAMGALGSSSGSRRGKREVSWTHSVLAIIVRLMG